MIFARDFFCDDGTLFWIMVLSYMENELLIEKNNNFSCIKDKKGGVLIMIMLNNVGMKKRKEKNSEDEQIRCLKHV